MATAGDLINSSLRLIGVLESGVNPSTQETADALASLNALLSQWQTEELSIFTIANHTFPLVAGTQDYTIGDGGDFDSPRPERITRAGVIQSNGIRNELQIITSDDWAAIPEKNVSALVPRVLYNDHDYPLSTLHLWPKPSGTPTLDLYAWEQFTPFAAATDTFDMPPGYWDAIRFNLAIRLANEWGRSITQELGAQAQAYKQSLIVLHKSNQAEVSEEAATAAPAQK